MTATASGYFPRAYFFDSFHGRPMVTEMLVENDIPCFHLAAIGINS